MNILGDTELTDVLKAEICKIWHQRFVSCNVLPSAGQSAPLQLFIKQGKKPRSASEQENTALVQPGSLEGQIVSGTKMFIESFMI